jgi:hypothetical protein
VFYFASVNEVPFGVHSVGIRVRTTQLKTTQRGFQTNSPNQIPNKLHSPDGDGQGTRRMAILPKAILG